MKTGPGLALLLFGFACGGIGCGQKPSPTVNAAPAASSDPAWDVTFEDVANRAGINFRVPRETSGPLNIRQTAPGGCAMVDLDQDGWLDVILVAPPRCAVYRNRKDGTFQDATHEFGLTQSGPWMGCTVGDFNNDAFPDLLLTGYRRTALLRNVQGKKLLDVTRAMGVESGRWTTSAAFADVDGDGWLDLYVGAYVDYHPGTLDLCTQGDVRMACGPEKYGPEKGALFLNRRGVKFEDATRVAGLESCSGKTWGVAFADYDNDGKPDLYLANDQAPGNLYHNLGKGKFAEIGIPSGTAYDAEGRVQGGMGVDWGDQNNDGFLDLFVSTYVYQDKQIYRNEAGAIFHPQSRQIGLAQPARPYVAFGGGFLDANNDGNLDLIIANGHIRDNAAAYEPTQTYRQPLQFFAASDQHQYREVSHAAGAAFQAPMVGRGLAFGDYDNNGLTDVLVMDLDGPARLLKNQGGLRAGNWLSVRLDAGRRNGEGIGARVTLEAGGRRQIREITRGRSVLSASDAEAHFGIGPAKRVDRLEIRWPNGQSQSWKEISANQRLTLHSNSRALTRNPLIQKSIGNL